MSKDCGNPDCPTHGNSPEAKARQANRQHIVTNEELMSVIRILAANVHESMAAKIGMSGQITLLQERILRGAGDSDPLVQGLIGGFIILLCDHYPTQQFAGLCSQIPENENIIKKLMGDASPEMPEGIMDIDELLLFLAGLRR